MDLKKMQTDVIYTDLSKALVRLCQPLSSLIQIKSAWVSM